MNVLLIAPASGGWRQVGRKTLFNGRTFRFSLLSLLSVAAVTPPGVRVRLVDEQIEEIPWAERFDLVGITCMTALAPRAYELASRFRELGVPVVLGGMHPTLCSEEAASHADAVVVGEAEKVWPQLLRDLEQGSLQRVYHGGTAESLAGLPRLPRELLSPQRYATVHAVQATRGCPHRCGFCAVSAFSEHTQRRRPVEEVVAEIAAIPAKFFMFVDDHLTADRDYARALFEALVPLRKQWVTQSTLAMAEDEALVALAAQAGCVGLFVGLETFAAENLASVGKDCHRVEQYRAAIGRLHAHGIGIEAGIVFGFARDRVEVFQRTLEILDELEMDAVQISIFTPLPGTPAFAAMGAKLLDRNWAHYDFHHAVFQPEGMSPESLQAGHDWVTREFYRPWRIARRVWRAWRRTKGWRQVKYVAGLNLAYLGRVVRWHIRGWDPAASDATLPLSHTWLRPPARVAQA